MTPRSVRSPRLKSLELQGYKTFATKTLFSFAPTITAIVGPNGTGKSNIADAIRWVLGEQAYSLLRGKKTEDMIFSGSELRARAGMASASIIFDNSDEWLPIDFSEVAVGRRAYRDGQNEYLINEQKVRLRDVAELLSESGLAERTYTVIGQGLVDAALSLRAEERRQLFEEAAGIGLYRARREESVRRLDATRRNLERVQDILAELRPRLRSLDRQAQRARDYEQVKNDLRSSLRTWYGYHWHEQQHRLSRARELAERHRLQRGRLLERQQTIENKLQLRRSSIKELRTRLDEWSGRSSELFTQRESLGRQVAVLRERIRWMEEQRGLVESELASLQRQRLQLDNSLEVAQKELENQASEVESLEANLENGDAQDSLGDRRSVEEQMERIRRDLEFLAASEAAWSARHTHWEEQRLQAKRVLSELSPELERAQAQWKDADQRLRRSETRRQQLEAELQSARDQQAEEIARERSLAQDLAQAEAEMASVEAEKSRLEASLSAIDEMRRGQEAGARVLLRAAEHGELSGDIERLLTTLKVSEAHRRAISTALGELMEALTLDDQEQLLSALEMLQSKPGPGRTILLSLESKTAYEVVEPPNRPGILGNALDFVRADPRVKQALERLLGTTWVVADRKTAMRLRAEVEDSVRLVTLTGELFLADGTVIVGEASHQGSEEDRQSLLAEMTFISQQTVAAAEQLADLRQRRQEAKAVVEEGDQEMDRLRRERQSSEAAVLPLRAEAEALKEAMTALRERSDLQMERLAEAEGRLGQLSEEGSAFEAERGKLERSLTELRRRMGEWNLGDADARLTARWEAARAALEAARERLAEIESRVGSSEADLEAKRAELGASAGEIEAIRVELAGLQSQAEQVEAQLEARSTELEPSERKLQEAERRRSELLEESSEVRAQLQRVENQFSQTQVQLARREEELRGLQRRIEDDFGLVAYEYDEATTGQEPLPFEGLVERLPAERRLPEGLKTQVQRLRAQLRRMGAINPEARAEHRAVKERVEFLTSQIDDLRSAESHIREVIAELDVIMAREFRKTFDLVAVEFKEAFQRLFDGGSARLELTDPSDPNETGIEIEARLPGKREQGLAVLSGGERSLAASALVFALLRVSPTPFCVLDEVDAMLDEVNVVRFCEMLQELSETTQFIVITHNRHTVQVAEAVYGVSMSADSTSKVISLDLEQAESEIAA